MTTRKPFLKVLNAVSLTFVSAALLSLNISVAQTVQLSVDRNHSNVSFSVPLAGGMTRITGKYNEFDIILNYVDTSITKSSIIAVIKSASISTGIPGRDEHLGTADFFDAAKYPDITFNSDSIVKISAGYIAFGTFQLHGISKKIMLPFTITGKDAEGSIGFSARYLLKRSDYAIGKSDTNFLSDEIDVEIDFMVKKKKEK